MTQDIQQKYLGTTEGGMNMDDPLRNAELRMTSRLWKELHGKRIEYVGQLKNISGHENLLNPIDLTHKSNIHMYIDYFGLMKYLRHL